MLKILSLAVTIILLDQGLKYWALASNLPTVTYNQGIALGIGREIEILGILVPLAVLISLAVFAYFQYGKSDSDSIDPIWVFLLTVIFSAGLSNFLDRIFRGAVVDFIKLQAAFPPNLMYEFPTFNPADAIIVTAVVVGLFWEFGRLLKSRTTGH